MNRGTNEGIYRKHILRTISWVKIFFIIREYHLEGLPRAMRSPEGLLKDLIGADEIIKNNIQKTLSRFVLRFPSHGSNLLQSPLLYVHRFILKFLYKLCSFLVTPKSIGQRF